MRRGFSLLEVLVSFLLLFLVGGTLLAVHTGILAGTRSSELHQDALARLETVAEVFRERVREKWPASVTTRGELEGFPYQVDDYGLVADPLDPSSSLLLKRLTVTLEYTVRLSGEERARSYSASFLVGR